MVRSLHRRKDLEESIAKGVDADRPVELADEMPPGRRALAWAMLVLVLMIPGAILLYLLT